jgi:hypothetical protein
VIDSVLLGVLARGALLCRSSNQKFGDNAGFLRCCIINLPSKSRHANVDNALCIAIFGNVRHGWLGGKRRMPTYIEHLKVASEEKGEQFSFHSHSKVIPFSETPF